ncbi:hypothetical protein PRIPAC_92617 [Pristionchus pacificus]|uniref:Uncharacterized protein n=1 Tax=Pristionchus pacificus TaxID=54126 RepID=A0A2A6CEG3_PRIPA|nr:hypothetical protein PRIPAC_92617 [Pristionchus pacificus]|eukprot:PDM76443.1 hypothetical protein PRIPAC_40047 [Pristionchus pacificus]
MHVNIAYLYSGVRNQLGIKQFPQVGIKLDGNLDGHIQNTVLLGTVGYRSHSCPKAVKIGL